MPLLEFKCEQGHLTERLVLSITAAELVTWVICETCGRVADSILSRPSPPKLIGAGFYKPSYD
jgi:predicted nucleic acid-binding Zn ribbon protein